VSRYCSFIRIGGVQLLAIHWSINCPATVPGVKPEARRAFYTVGLDDIDKMVESCETGVGRDACLRPNGTKLISLAGHACSALGQCDRRCARGPFQASSTAPTSRSRWTRTRPSLTPS
jgi:hypothetical protein